MTDSRTRFFSRWQRDCKRREMLRKMKLWIKEMSKYDNTKREASGNVQAGFSGTGADPVPQSQGRDYRDYLDCNVVGEEISSQPEDSDGEMQITVAV